MLAVMKSRSLKFQGPSRFVHAFTFEVMCYKLKVTGSIPNDVIGIILLAALWPWSQFIL